MSRKQPQRQVSIRADSYDGLKAASDFMQTPVSKIVDRLINDFIDEEERPKPPPPSRFRGEF